MDLDQARKVVGSHAYLHGESSDGLIHRVMNAPGFVNPGKTLSPASGLENGVVLRPIEALHQLAYATASRYQDDLLDIYAQWGLLRYLAFFDLVDVEDLTRTGPPRLKVSDAGSRIVGNQRRVASEEIGIGFGVLLARQWFARTGAGMAPVSIIDLDAALDDRYVFAGGARQAVRKIGKHRPDYLLVAADPQASRRYRIRTLECKGTKNRRTAIQQLGKAVRQLDGITVDGRTPVGLATSVVASDGALSYLAIDPGDEEEPAYEFNSRLIDETRRFRLRDDIRDQPSLALTNAAVSASWAMLADFGGNFLARERWTPEIMRARLRRRPRDRVHFDTPFGGARGTSVTFDFAEGQITARYAISEAVDQELGQGTTDRIIEAQAAFANRLSRDDEATSLAGDNELYSATTDGSIFSLSLR
ncbi:hypothetical protein [Amycolatopsis sp. EV170708-02-1]|uniref:hypothetical protein n=1 Tax=Amycolatopsis sp. EV170708-02-1 TaxID=2919322 RepID=UPI001F0BC4B6|nr:hypothetical protein [Amycolatopsis sp. EV170708-02-1]UMO99596.1 hypothetical protein MJQ72_23965 [Amycolatopsis sp. EV170708-02-1]